MESNPESLEARRRAYTETSGFDPDEWGTLTELVDTPTQPTDMTLVSAMFNQIQDSPIGSKIKLVFRSAVVPWSRVWVTVPAGVAVSQTAGVCEGRLWALESYLIIPPRIKYKPLKIARSRRAVRNRTNDPSKLHRVRPSYRKVS